MRLQRLRTQRGPQQLPHSERVLHNLFMHPDVPLHGDVSLHLHGLRVRVLDNLGLPEDLHMRVRQDLHLPVDLDRADPVTNRSWHHEDLCA